MKPGTPVLAATYQGKPVLCVSGSPFAAIVNFHVFFWPMLAKRRAAARYLAARARGTCTRDNEAARLRRIVGAPSLPRRRALVHGQAWRVGALEPSGFNCMSDQARMLRFGRDVVNVLWPEGDWVTGPEKTGVSPRTTP
jgi:molybdopterin molybdotransferase